MRRERSRRDRYSCARNDGRGFGGSILRWEPRISLSSRSMVLSTHPIQFPRSYIGHVNVFDGGIAEWARLPHLQPIE